MIVGNFLRSYANPCLQRIERHPPFFRFFYKRIHLWWDLKDTAKSSLIKKLCVIGMYEYFFALLKRFSDCWLQWYVSDQFQVSWKFV